MPLTYTFTGEDSAVANGTIYLFSNYPGGLGPFNASANNDLLPQILPDFLMQGDTISTVTQATIVNHVFSGSFTPSGPITAIIAADDAENVVATWDLPNSVYASAGDTFNVSSTASLSEVGPTDGANGSEGAAGVAAAASTTQASSNISPIGTLGGTGATGAPKASIAVGDSVATGATGASPFSSMMAAQNPDGSTSTTFSQGVFFKHTPFYAFTDTTASDGTLQSEVHYRKDGATRVDLFTSGETQQSVYYDTFNIGPQSGADTFVFQPGHGADVVNGFQPGGANHDALSFSRSDFSSIAAILHNTTNTSAGAVIHDPTGNGDTVRLTGISKADLAANAKADFKLHG